MPNHFHILAYQTEEDTIDRFMNSFELDTDVFSMPNTIVSVLCTKACIKQSC